MKQIVILTIINKKDKALKPCLYAYTGGRGRTGTPSRALDFESSASANSATPAYQEGGNRI